MKTTIEIPKPLFRKVKARAAERGQTLRELFTEALREKLEYKSDNNRPGTSMDEGIRQATATAQGDGACSEHD